MLLGLISHYFFGLSIFFTSLFLVLLVLVQRGRGGGIAGALGGAGGQSAFGTKAGDLFTRITVGVAIVWIMLCCGAIYFLKTAAFSTGITEKKDTGSETSEIGGGSGTTGSDLTGGGGLGTPDGLGGLSAPAGSPIAGAGTAGATAPATTGSGTTPASTTPAATGTAEVTEIPGAETTPPANTPATPDVPATKPETPATTPETPAATTPPASGDNPPAPTTPNS
jgi:preprotein translocase subunit SecG